LSYISEFSDGHEIYPSDIAPEYGTDMKCVEDALEKMLAEGIFR